MKGKTGKEMRQLMLAVSLSVLVLLLGIITYFMVDIIVTTNNNIEHNKQMAIDKSVISLSEIGEIVSNMTSSSSMTQLFNRDLVKEIAAGNQEALYDLAGKFCTIFYPIEYIGIIRDGELEYYSTKGDIEIDPASMPTEPPQGEYGTMDELGGEKGLYISAFYPIDLSVLGMGELEVNMIVDRTDELATVEKYFEDQRNDLILRLSIASVIAVILSLLLTTFGLRYFTRKYVVKPIEELNRTAEEIADGTFEGEVQVDEESAYAALQGLLRSGQKVLQHMDQEIKG